MKNLRVKWALLTAMSIPGLALNSCWNVLLAEMRDAAITGFGNFTQDTTYDLLDAWANPDE